MTDKRKSPPVLIICEMCGKHCGYEYFMCDLSDDDDTQWCRTCFDKTPCGCGLHGEGCATLVCSDA